MTKRQANPKRARPNAFKKGNPRPPNSGRAKGTRNRRTALLKDAILKAAELVGQDGRGKNGLTGYLMQLAVKEKAVYARLLEKVLPLQIAVEDRTKPQYTVEEAIKRLKERGFPVPTSLLSLVPLSETPATIAGAIVACEEDYEAELCGESDGSEDEPNNR